jgi:hypothetical protein
VLCGVSGGYATKQLKMLSYAWFDSPKLLPRFHPELCKTGSQALTAVPGIDPGTVNDYQPWDMSY